MRDLLTVGNPKTAKGEGHGYLTAIFHAAPANLSGVEVCQYRTKGCTEGCLNTSGRGGIFKRGETTNKIQEARIWRTRFYAEDRAAFLAQLRKEIAAHVKRAARHGMLPAVRLNGTSDLAVESWGIMQEFPAVKFYDYTKNPHRMAAFLRGEMPANYSLTFSMAESKANRMAAFQVLSDGGNVAAVFAVKRGESLPMFWQGFAVIDGDATDLRFLDARGADLGHVVGLRAKGKAIRDRSGFVIREF